MNGAINWFTLDLKSKTNVPERGVNGISGEGLAVHEIEEDKDMEGEGIYYLLLLESNNLLLLNLDS